VVARAATTAEACWFLGRSSTTSSGEVAKVTFLRLRGGGGGVGGRAGTKLLVDGRQSEESSNMSKSR
jgi:hypothetical protein